MSFYRYRKRGSLHNTCKKHRDNAAQELRRQQRRINSAELPGCLWVGPCRPPQLNYSTHRTTCTPCTVSVHDTRKQSTRREWEMGWNLNVWSGPQGCGHLQAFCMWCDSLNRPLRWQINHLTWFSVLQTADPTEL